MDSESLFLDAASSGLLPAHHCARLKLTMSGNLTNPGSSRRVLAWPPLPEFSHEEWKVHGMPVVDRSIIGLSGIAFV